jgi:hypothetical protein
VTDRHALGKRSESDAALAELIRKYEREMACNIAYVLAFRGEADRAYRRASSNQSNAADPHCSGRVPHRA